MSFASTCHETEDNCEVGKDVAILATSVVWSIIRRSHDTREKH